ncbi:MAG: hypothetical protein GC204_12435 [Chloroflexi bacterium]|nr:hypothetical protein [Chloroflexota bacterium]
MTDIHVSVDIQRPPEAVFNLLADIAHYRDWLPPSKTYVETTDISDTPLREGTTYVDKNTNGTMIGEVREYQPYSRIVFYQIGRNPHVEVTTRYQLTPTPQGTHLERTSTVVLSGIYRLLQPLGVRQVRAENGRTLATLKAYLESQPV